MVMSLKAIRASYVRKYIVLSAALVILISCASTKQEKSETNLTVDAYVRQSLQYINAGRLDAALLSIKKATELNPESADAYTVAGLIYSKNNQKDLAERYYKRALSIEPNHSAAQINYANFLCKYDRPLEAEKIFIAAANNLKNKQPELAYTNAGLCVLGIPDTIKASNYFSKALRINPKLPIPLYQLAKIQYANYEYELAHRYLQEYEKIASPTPKTLLLGAQLGEALNNIQMANQYKLLLAQQFPASAEAKQIHVQTTSEENPAVLDVRGIVENESTY